jgi:thiol peroxidase
MKSDDMQLKILEEIMIKTFLSHHGKIFPIVILLIMAGGWMGGEQLLFGRGRAWAGSVPEERSGIATFKGNPITLIGPELKMGDPAPDFKLVANDLSETTLTATKGKFRVVTSLLSLDTPVCDLQARRFNQEAAKFPEDVVVDVVSMDLPFAQKRWCGAAGASNIHTLSDHRDGTFGTAYGVMIREMRLLSRAVFIIDPDGKIIYVEYVREATQQPDYDAALNALKSALTTKKANP